MRAARPVVWSTGWAPRDGAERNAGRTARGPNQSKEIALTKLVSALMM